MNKRTSLGFFGKSKRAGEKIVMVTAYDAVFAAAAADAGIEVLLVGDSLGPNVLGYRNTIPVTMEEMLIHTKAVRRGAPDAFVVFDMPFMSYQESMEKALHNAGVAIKETDCDAVKLEGGAAQAPLIKALVDTGIPVMAHIGLLPQRVQAVGAYKVRGRTEEDELQLLADAKKVEEAGAFSVVLECMPAALGEKISRSLSIPTIGIGSGAGCDGQVQVLNDILGMNDFTPHHAKHYGEIGNAVREALQNYASEVRAGIFPDDEHSF